MGAKRRMKKNDIESIDQALEVLNEMADESAEEIRDMVDRDYRKLRRVMNELGPEVRTVIADAKDTAIEGINEFKDKAIESSQDAAKAVDKSVHSNPWSYIGGAVALAGLAGYLLGRSKDGQS